METYTSKQILESDDLYHLQDQFCSLGVPFRYIMTKGEALWFLKFVRGRYCIADWIDENTKENKHGELVLTFNDCEEMSQALHNDDSPFRAVMLSDKTALQKLFFWLSIEM